VAVAGDHWWVTEREKPLAFDDLIGELRELNGRVVALEVRDEQKNLTARAEGEFGHLEESPPGCWSFQLGGDPPPDREGLRFIVASWVSIQLDFGGIREVHDVSPGRIGPTVDLRIRLVNGTSVALWPAMPPSEQWTDRHEENR
jgi:hypothetical protein